MGIFHKKNPNGPPPVDSSQARPGVANVPTARVGPGVGRGVGWGEGLWVGLRVGLLAAGFGVRRLPYVLVCHCWYLPRHVGVEAAVP